MSEPVAIDVYIDYACPYVYRAAHWLREVERQLGPGQLVVNWKFFPLEQVNAPDDAEHPLWELPADRRSRGRDSLHAAVAARRQGREAFSRFNAELLALKHEQDQDHGRLTTLRQAATLANLDLDRFNADIEDRSLLSEIRDDYLSGREDLGVFGTPTIVFANGQSAYLQLNPTPSPEEAVPFWEEFVRAVRDRPFLREIKRPRKPQ